MLRIFALLVGLTLCGCNQSTINAMNPGKWFAKKPAASAGASAETRASATPARAVVMPPDALDPVIEGPMRVQMDLYQLSVPFGTVSSRPSISSVTVAMSVALTRATPSAAAAGCAAGGRGS